MGVMRAVFLLLCLIVALASTAARCAHYPTGMYTALGAGVVFLSEYSAVLVDIPKSVLGTLTFEGFDSPQPMSNDSKYLLTFALGNAVNKYLATELELSYRGGPDPGIAPSVPPYTTLIEPEIVNVMWNVYLTSPLAQGLSIYGVMGVGVTLFNARGAYTVSGLAVDKVSGDATPLLISGILSSALKSTWGAKFGLGALYPINNGLVFGMGYNMFVIGEVNNPHDVGSWARVYDGDGAVVDDVVVENSTFNIADLKFNGGEVVLMCKLFFAT